MCALCGELYHSSTTFEDQVAEFKRIYGRAPEDGDKQVCGPCWDLAVESGAYRETHT